MAGKIFQVAFQVGGALTPGFSKTVFGATSGLDKIGKKVGTLGKIRTDVSNFEKVRRSIDTTKESLAAAREKTRQLGLEMKRTKSPSAAMQRAFGGAQKKVALLENKLRLQRSSLGSLSGALRSAGFSTKNFAASQAALNTQLTKSKAIQESLLRSQAARKANLDDRSRYRSRLMGTVAMGVSLATPIMAAIKAQQAEARLKTVMAVGGTGKEHNRLRKAALKTARSQARDLARAGIAGYSEAFNIQYALNSAGIEEKVAESASETVAKVAKLAGGVPEEVAEVIGTTYNNLGKQLEGTSKEKLRAIGDMMTKVQFKYQIRNFGQLGESVKKAAASFSMFNVDARQGFAGLGILNNAGLGGAEAGTGMSAMLRQLEKAQEGMGITIERNKKGELDLIETLRNIDDALAGLSDDERAQIIQKNFGDEGARALVPLLGSLDHIDKDVKEIEDAAKDGLVDKEIGEYMSTAAGQVAALKGSVVVLADVLGRTLLPAVNMVVKPTANILNNFSSFLEEHAAFKSLLMGTIASLIGLKIATFALGYGFTFLKGGVLNTVNIFHNLRAALFLARNGTKALTAAQVEGTAVGKAAIVVQKAWKAALSTNPIFLAIAGITALVAVGVWLYRNWDTVSKRVGAAWDYMREKGSGVIDWFKSIPGMIAKALSGVGDIIFGSLKSGFDKLLHFLGKIGHVWNGLKNAISGNKRVQEINSKAIGDTSALLGIPKMAAGGVATSPTFSVWGERGKEYMIPVTSPNNDRGKALWAAAGRDLGMLPASGGAAGAYDMATEAMDAWDLVKVAAKGGRWLSGRIAGMVSGTAMAASALKNPRVGLGKMAALGAAGTLALFSASDLMGGTQYVADAATIPPSVGKRLPEMNVAYSPNITVYTSGNPEDTADAVNKALHGDLDEFIRRLHEAMEQERRLALE